MKQLKMHVPAAVFLDGGDAAVIRQLVSNQTAGHSRALSDRAEARQRRI